MAVKGKVKAPKDKTKKDRRQKYSINDPAYRQMADEYMVNGRNQTRAYLKIFPDVKYESARVEASKAFSDPNISAYVTEREAEVKAEYRAKYELTEERIAQELARLAYADIRKAYDASGNPLPVHLLDDDTAAALASVDVFTEFEGSGTDRQAVGETRKLKFYDKGRALSDAMKHIGMFEADNKQKSDPIRELLEAVNARGAGLPIKP